MPADQIVQQKFGDWKAGPWHSYGASKGPAQGKRYDSINLQVYDNGTLGVRPCLEDCSVSSFSITTANYDGLGYWHDNYNYSLRSAGLKYLFLFDSSTSVPTVDIVSKSIGSKTVSTAASISRQGLPPQYNNTYQQAIGRLSSTEVGITNGIYGADAEIGNFTTPAPVAFTYPVSWDPHSIIKHRDRYWSWGDASNANRIHYTTPGDYTDWTTNAEFVDIGADTNLPIVGVWQLYDSLVIAMKDLRWYIFRFTGDPQYGEIRYIGTKRIPDFSEQAAEPGDSLLFITEQGGITVVTPDSIDDQSLSYIKVPVGLPLSLDHYFLRGLSLSERGAIVLPFIINGIALNSKHDIHKGDFSFDYINGVWVKSLYFGVDSSDLNPDMIDTFVAGTNHAGFVFADDNNSGSTWKVYVRPTTLNRPSNSSDTFANSTEIAAHTNDATDRFSAELYLAEFRATEGDTAIIERVIVDFDYWSATGFETPAFTCVYDCEASGTVYESQSIGVLDGASLPSSSTYNPERGRAVLQPAPGPAASSFNIRFTGIKSIAFDEITVEYRVQTQEPITSQMET